MGRESQCLSLSLVKDEALLPAILNFISSFYLQVGILIEDTQAHCNLAIEGVFIVFSIVGFLWKMFRIFL